MRISIHVCALGGDRGFVVRVFLVDGLRLLLHDLHLDVEVLVHLLEVLGELTVLICKVRAVLHYKLVNVAFLSAILIVNLVKELGLFLLHHKVDLCFSEGSRPQGRLSTNVSH